MSALSSSSTRRGVSSHRRVFQHFCALLVIAGMLLAPAGPLVQQAHAQAEPALVGPVTEGPAIVGDVAMPANNRCLVWVKRDTE